MSENDFECHEIPMEIPNLLSSPWEPVDFSQMQVRVQQAATGQAVGLS